MGQIELTATSAGAEQTKNILSSIKVQTAPVHVGNSSYSEFVASDSSNVTVGMFFDGTGNNRENTESKLLFKRQDKGEELSLEDQEKADKYIDHKATLIDIIKNIDYNSTLIDIIKNKGFNIRRTGSYDNDYSNIARLAKYYEEDKDKDAKQAQLKVYVEGIGTTNGGDDDIPGGATGMSALFKFYNTGIKDKVKKGCEELVEKIIKLKKEDINLLTVDVYGFSRGAAAARHFVSEISKRKGQHKKYTGRNGQRKSVTYTVNGGLVGEKLKEENINVKMIKIRFVGLFDCVASHGLAQKDDVDDLRLDAIKNAQHTFHLASSDEHRFKFSLTDISSAGSKGVEKFLPGVHSDVGGCYVNEAPEKNIMLNFATKYRASQLRFKKDYEYLIEQGWYDKKQLTISENKLDLSTRVGLNDNSEKILTGNRNSLRNEYSFIPLQFMCEQSVNKNVLYKPLADLKKEFDISKEAPLVNAEKRLRKYVFEKGDRLNFYENEKDKKLLISLRNKYFHFSADYLSIGMLPQWEGDMRAREIYSDSKPGTSKVALLEYPNPISSNGDADYYYKKRQKELMELTTKKKSSIPPVKPNKFK